MDLEQLHAALLSAIFAPSPALEQQLQLLSADPKSLTPASGDKGKMKIVAVRSATARSLIMVSACSPQP